MHYFVTALIIQCRVKFCAVYCEHCISQLRNKKWPPVFIYIYSLMQTQESVWENLKVSGM